MDPKKDSRSTSIKSRVSFALGRAHHHCFFFFCYQTHYTSSNRLQNILEGLHSRGRIAKTCSSRVFRLVLRSD